MELTKKSIKSDVKLRITNEYNEVIEINAHTQILAHSSDYFCNELYGNFSANSGILNVTIAKEERKAFLALFHFIYKGELPSMDIEDLVRCIGLNSYFLVSNARAPILDRIHTIDIGGEVGIAFLDNILLDTWEPIEWRKIKSSLLFETGNLNHDVLVYLGNLEVHKLRILIDKIFTNDITVISIALFWLYINNDIIGFYYLIEKDILHNINTAKFYRNGKDYLKAWCILNDIKYSEPPFDNKEIDDQFKPFDNGIPEILMGNRGFLTHYIIDITRGEKKNFYLLGNNTVLEFNVEYDNKEIIVTLDLCKLVKHNAFDNSYAQNIKILKFGDPVKMIPRQETEQIIFLYTNDWKYLKDKADKMLKFFIHLEYF